MDENNAQRDIEVTNPDNVLEGKRYFGFRRRNIIEGLIAALVFFLIIRYIPFVPRVKIIFWIAVCGSVFVINCVGFKDKSFSEIIIYLSKNKKIPKVLHMRSIADASKKRRKIEVATNGRTYTNLSIAEKIFFYSKDKYKEYKKRK